MEKLVPAVKRSNEQDAGLKEKVCYKCKKTGHIVRDCPYETASLSAKDEQPTYVGDSQNLATERIQKASTDDDAIGRRVYKKTLDSVL